MDLGDEGGEDERGREEREFRGLLSWILRTLRVRDSGEDWGSALKTLKYSHWLPAFGQRLKHVLLQT